jgi:hypothetical protein
MDRLIDYQMVCCNPAWIQVFLQSVRELSAEKP